MCLTVKVKPCGCFLVRWPMTEGSGAQSSSVTSSLTAVCLSAAWLPARAEVEEELLWL